MVYWEKRKLKVCVYENKEASIHLVNTHILSNHRNALHDHNGSFYMAYDLI